MIVRPLPDFSFRGAVHERLAHRRGDAAFLEQAWADPQTRVLVVHGSELATSTAGDALAYVAPAQAPPGERMLLGAAEGVVYFLVVVERRPDDHKEGFASLRSVARSLSRLDESLAVHAVALAQWHARHSRCAVCGDRTQVEEAGASRRCPSCTTQHYPRTDPAVIMLVVDDAGRALLGHNAARDASWYSTLAGFVEPGETLEDAVVREVAEETGVVVDDVRYAGSQPWPFPSSLMLGFHAHASSTAIDVDGVEITTARWFTRDDLRREVEQGQLVIPSTISISGALVESWYGDRLPGPRTP